jgi:hypothetical protein
MNEENILLMICIAYFFKRDTKAKLFIKCIDILHHAATIARTNHFEASNTFLLAFPRLLFIADCIHCIIITPFTSLTNTVMLSYFEKLPDALIADIEARIFNRDIDEVFYINPCKANVLNKKYRRTYSPILQFYNEVLKDAETYETKEL